MKKRKFVYEEDEDNFYTEQYLQESVDSDEISGEEAGFMMGYLDN